MGSGGIVAVKVLSYTRAVDRIEWERSLKLVALRDNILAAVAQRLRNFAPNSPTNIKHPWKLSEQFSIRAWCPLHDGRWARLIVRADEAGHVTFECSAGCCPQLIRDHIGAFDVGNSSEPTSVIGRFADSRRQLLTARPSNLLDARHRFHSDSHRRSTSHFPNDEPAA
jgi:hypothetical protein